MTSSVFINTRDQLHVSVAVAVTLTGLLLGVVAVTVMGDGAALMQVATPKVVSCALPMLAFTGSETVHVTVCSELRAKAHPFGAPV